MAALGMRAGARAPTRRVNVRTGLEARRSVVSAPLVGTAPRVQQPGRNGFHVMNARVSGVEIPNNKRIETSLTYIFGIGDTKAKEILVKTSVDNKRTKDLDEEELGKIRAVIEEEYTVEGDLRRQKLMALKRLTDIGCYRGRRHMNNLPVRGQRTKTNARTRKGRKKTVAGKGKK
mmetsp:Transcript_19731/g.67175  ORF Transcript_19731/g.67175 Transcript_19731/m.67175 type:complete len:175 (+) Transcript_19731:63-587(+)